MITSVLEALQTGETKRVSFREYTIIRARIDRLESDDAQTRLWIWDDSCSESLRCIISTQQPCCRTVAKMTPGDLVEVRGALEPSAAEDELLDLSVLTAKPVSSLTTSPIQDPTPMTEVKIVNGEAWCREGTAWRYRKQT